MKNTLKEARDCQDSVHAMAKKLGVDPPPYEFMEMIGKGSFGGVFKCRQLSTGRQSLAGTIVAVKIIETDQEDLAELWSRRGENLVAFEKEVAALVGLSNSGARNINKIYDAFSFGASLWIVSEHCPGGSVNTLMKASEGKGLDERHVIPIARELAIALKDIHAANYIHRDVKAANVLITQDGKLQLCDFGVAGIFEEVGPASKRTTIVGTPHWMPPEMIKAQSATMSQGYGTEVDCWSFGVTMYEIAAGHPPKAHMPFELLKAADDDDPPRLDKAEHPAELCDFVAFCLESDPAKRPSAAQIVDHPYLAGTDRSHPSATLKELIANFREWESLGGSRASLFIMPSEGGPALEKEDEDWNFADDPADDLAANPEQPVSTAEPYLTQWDRERAYRMAERAGERFQNLFDETTDKEYEYEDNFFRPQPVVAQTARTVVPNPGGLQAPPLLRRAHSEQVPDNRMSTASGMIDLDEAMMPDEPLYADIGGTVKPQRSMPRFTLDEADDDDRLSWQYEPDYARRDTRDWTFPSKTAPTSTATSEIEGSNRRTQDWTFPSSDTGEHRRTQDWTFPTAEMAKNRRTQDWTFASATAASITSGSAVDPQETRRRTQDWTLASAMASYDTDLDTDGPGGTPELDQGPASDSDDLRSLPAHHLRAPSHAGRWRPPPNSLQTIAGPSAQALSLDADPAVVTDELVDLLDRMRIEVARTSLALEQVCPRSSRHTRANGSGGSRRSGRH